MTAELPRSLHKPLSPGQELQAIPTTVALTSSIKDHEPAPLSWGNHEARASLKLTLSSVCEQLLSPPPQEPPITHVWSQEPVDVPPSMAVTVASFCAPSPVDMSTLGLHSSMFLPKTSASGPLTPPAHLQLLETRSRVPGSTAALLEPTPGEYDPWGVARTLAHLQGCLTHLPKWTQPGHRGCARFTHASIHSLITIANEHMLAFVLGPAPARRRHSSKQEKVDFLH